MKITDESAAPKLSAGQTMRSVKTTWRIFGKDIVIERDERGDVFVQGDRVEMAKTKACDRREVDQMGATHRPADRDRTGR